MQQDLHAGLINLLDPSIIPDEGKTAVIDFVELSKVLGYVHRKRVACTGVVPPFSICGKPGPRRLISVWSASSRNDILPIVWEDKRLKGDSISARAQLAAGAVAAFSKNNVFPC